MQVLSSMHCTQRPALLHTGASASHWVLSVQGTHWCRALHLEASRAVHWLLVRQATHSLTTGSQWPLASSRQVESSTHATQRLPGLQTCPLAHSVLSTHGTHSLRAVLHCGVVPEQSPFPMQPTHSPSAHTPLGALHWPGPVQVVVHWLEP